MLYDDLCTQVAARKGDSGEMSAVAHVTFVSGAGAHLYDKLMFAGFDTAGKAHL
ncbi:hypothetical protein [Prauserella aidingensis]|uniref:hypothetical protein n=1 Tax=Prauserella aidingensis TaxID=387890 RepID=UPI0020A26DE5|nr:hypothetical protein [Prauserella aidingensis]